MTFADKTIVITGGASGIGAALARKFSEEGARVCVADIDEMSASQLAAEIGGMALRCDVSQEDEIKSAISKTEARLGKVDIFVSNAGIVRPQSGHAASASDEDWDLNWRVHVMAHVWAARTLLPSMISRGSGYFVNIASAAGLLNQIGNAAYSATKHAAVSFGESLSISHSHEGIGVSVVCPQYVATPLIGLGDADARGSLLTAGQVAEAIIAGVETNTFLILSHPGVHDYALKRAQDHARWIRGMQALRAKAESAFGHAGAENLYRLV